MQTQSDLKQERLKVGDREDIIDHLKTYCENFREESDKWENRYRNLVAATQNGEVYREIGNDMNYWMRRSDRLTGLANGLLDRVLNKLKASNDAIMPLETPDDIQKFLKCCNGIIIEFKRRIRGH